MINYPLHSGTDEAMEKILEQYDKGMQEILDSGTETTHSGHQKRNSFERRALMKLIELLPKNRARKLGMVRSAIALVVVLAIVAIATTAMNVSPKIPITGGDQPVVYGDAMEKQYAAPWVAEQNKPAYTHALEMQYARPWLQNASQYGDAMEMQYAAPWLKAAGEIDCNSRLDLLYACQYGIGHR